MEMLSLLGVFLFGGIIGAVIMRLWNKAHSQGGDEALRVELAQLKIEKNAEAEKVQWVQEAEGKLREALESLASQSLRHNADAFLEQAHTKMTSVLNEVRGDWKTQKSEMQTLVNPVRENLDKLDGHVRLLEEKREGAYRELGQQLKELADAQYKLQDTTVTLSQALKSSSVRGQWGEVQLRRVVELAGMERHVAFEEQAAGVQGRPDMIVHLPGGGTLPVDSKTPMTAYLAATEAGDDSAMYKNHMKAHAKAVQDRVRELAQKAYWEQFEKTPEFVVMFVPVEASVAAAFEEAPRLLDDALQRKVLIATPVTLLALLKAVAYGWQQQEISENARRIANEGKELYKRIGTFLKHFSDLRKGLNTAIGKYNDSVGSLESRVLPSVRKLQELSIGDSELDEPNAIHQSVRSLRAKEKP